MYFTGRLYLRQYQNPDLVDPETICPLSDDELWGVDTVGINRELSMGVAVLKAGNNIIGGIGLLHSEDFLKHVF